MFRQATIHDLDAICAIYDAIHTQEEAGITTIGWIRSVYPTRQTAKLAIEKEDMFVLEAEGRVVACGRINQEQVDCYQDGNWKYEAKEQDVMVLHTLVVDPAKSRMGYGAQFLTFYEAFAKEHDCPYLRIDTNARNTRARAFYQKNGYWEVGSVPCVFNGIPGVELILLEKKV